MPEPTRMIADPDWPRRVCVVDDDAALTTLVSALFRAEGCEVSTAHDGQEAIELVSGTMAQGLAPDLIVLDMHMAGADGWEFRAQLDRLGVSIPIVVATGDPNPQRCAEEINAVGYIAKPFDLRDFDRLFAHLVLTGTQISRNRPAS
jgi:CheY-like chemotaxis protein